MERLDFLFSHSPNAFIFQNEANKTKFGGFLFLIYIIISLLIFIFYLYNYITNNKYSVDYSLSFRTLNDINDTINDTELNPILNVAFELMDSNMTFLNSKFKLFDGNELLERDNLKFIKTDSFIKGRVSDMIIGIAYECNNSSCIIEDYNQNIPLYHNMVIMLYKGFRLDHEDSNNPLKSNINMVTFPFYNNKFTFTLLDWENVIYNHNKNGIDLIRSLKEKHISGFVDSFYTLEPELIKNIYEDNDGKNYKILSAFKFRLKYEQYIEYTRTRNNEIDLIGLVFSLSSSILAGLQFIFNFYSKNFDHYKIIEKILSLNNINLRNKTGGNKKGLNESPFTSKNKTNNDNNLELTQLDKSPLVDDSNEEKNLSINDDDDSNNVGIDTDKNKTQVEIPKLGFLDYYINNIYCCYKSHNNNQEIINICNEIISKYYSIDYIIYNILKLENLFKDYKWNNPSLTNIENNEIFMKLKSEL